MAAETTPLYRPSGHSNYREGAREMLHRVRETAHTAYAHRRPWSEMLNRTSFGKPESFTDAILRLKHNLSYFHVNYAIFMLVCVGLSLIRHPMSLSFLVALICAWLYFYFLRTEPFVVLNRPFGDTEVLIFLSILTIVVLFLTKAGIALISALLVGSAVICLHGVFRTQDDLYTEERSALVGHSSGAPAHTRSQPLVSSV